MKTEIIDLLRNSENVKIEYDKVQKMVFVDKDIHYVMFELNNKKYVYSETNISYCISKIENNEEKMLLATISKNEMKEYFKNNLKLG